MFSIRLGHKFNFPIPEFLHLGLSFVLLLSVGLQGCSASNFCLSLPFEGKDSFHFLIFGMGIVTVPKTNGQTAVLAAKSQALGIHFSDQPGMKFGIGYSSSSIVVIPGDAEDVRVEVSQSPGGSLIVDSSKAKLRKR